MASIPVLIGHKMLCPNGDKIMPVDRDCQGLSRILFLDFFIYITTSYDIICSKSFKNQQKKMTLL
jgi:hypothetical protein